MSFASLLLWSAVAIAWHVLILPVAVSAADAEPLALESPDVPVYALAVSHDGKLIAGLSTGTLSLWRVDGKGDFKKPIAQIKVPDNQSFDPRVYSAPLVLSRQGDRAAVPIAKANPPSVFATIGVQIWDISEPMRAKEIATFPGEEKMQTSNGYYAFSPDGSELAVALNAKLEVWNPSTGKKRAMSTEPWSEADAQFIRYADDGKKLATMRKDGFVRLWQLENGRILGSGKVATSKYTITPRQARSGIVGVDMGCVSPDMKSAAIIDMDRGGADCVTLWDITKGKRLHDAVKLRDPNDKITWVNWSEDGKRLVYHLSTRKATSVGIYDVAAKKELARLESKSGLYAVAMSGDSRYIAASSPSTKTVLVWSVEDVVGNHDQKTDK